MATLLMKYLLIPSILNLVPFIVACLPFAFTYVPIFFSNVLAAKDGPCQVETKD